MLIVYMEEAGQPGLKVALDVISRNLRLLPMNAKDAKMSRVPESFKYMLRDLAQFIN